MTHIQPSTAKSIRLHVEDFDELLDRISRKIDRGNRRVHALRADWSHDPDDGSVLLRLDLVEARHLQQHFGEQDGEALRAISRAFGIPPRNWQAYGGTPPGCDGLSAAHNRENTSY